MPHLAALLGFALVCLGMVLTPGPNMIYLISRSISQGAAAGMVSLGGGVLGQSVVFGSIQIVISVSVNAMIALTAGSITGYLAARPVWLKAQRWLMGTVLAGFALKMAFEAKRV